MQQHHPGGAPARQPLPAAAAAPSALTNETRSSFEIKMIQAGRAGADRRVVYECNFSVDMEVSREFMQYLRGHMREVRGVFWGGGVPLHGGVCLHGEQACIHHGGPWRQGWALPSPPPRSIHTTTTSALPPPPLKQQRRPTDRLPRGGRAL